MKVKLVYKTENNEFFGTVKHNLTIKEAKILSDKLLKENKNIVEIYLKHFDGWHWHRIKTLYKKENN
jgi:hypothetical protein